MKRSYPYTGPGAGPAAAGAAPAGIAGAAQGSAPDYSGYGYGPVAGQHNATASGSASNNVANDAQQAQWHQQWQQYYAQQAAAANAPAQPQAPQPMQRQQQHQQQAFPQGGPQPSPQQYPRPPVAQGPYGQQQPQYGAAMGAQFPQPSQPQAQPQQPYYGQYPSQQPQQPMAPPVGTAGYAGSWQQPQPAASMQSFNTTQAIPQQPMQQPFQGAQASQQGFYGSNAPMAMSPGAPAAKRQRMDNTGGMRSGYVHASPSVGPAQAVYSAPFGGPNGSPGRPGMAAPSRPAYGSPAHASGAGSRSSNRTHGQNGRAGSGMQGAGPSNMAAPMAAAPKSQGLGNQPRPFGAVRMNRNQNGHNRGAQNSQSNASSSGKFSGPVGVNAIGPTGGARSGFGQRAAGSSKLPAQNGRQNQQAGVANKSSRQDPQRGGTASKKQEQKAPTGPAAPSRSNETVYNLQKPAFAQGRTSSASDQPVPPGSKRTFSDFKVSGIYIDELDWYWSVGNDNEQDPDESVGKDAPADKSEEKDKAEEGVEKSKENRRARHGRKRAENTKEGSRLRMCFAANPPPSNAPTGPKALVQASQKKKESAAKAEETEMDEKSVKEGPNDADEESKDDEGADGLEWTAFSRGPPQSSTNRISISYATNRCRMVIDADAIKHLTLNRAESHVEMTVNVVTAPNVKRKDQQEKRKGEEWVIVKGLLLEARRSDSDNFAAVPRRELEQWWKERKISRNSSDAEDSASVNGSGKKEDDLSARGEGKTVEKSAADAEDGASGSGSENVQAEIEGAVEKEGSSENDATSGGYQHLPPFFRLLEQHNGPAEDVQHPACRAETLTIRVAVDDLSSAAKWVRTGDISEWLSVLPSLQPSIGSEPLQGWISKIAVLDPDAPPTLSDILEDWSRTSLAGHSRDREQFLQCADLEHYQGLGELMARIVRGDRSMHTPGHKELSLVLRDALSLSQFEASQSYLSLSVLAILRMLQDFGIHSEEQMGSITEQLREILLSIPLHLVFRALDSLCKESIDKQRLRAMQEKSLRAKEEETEAKIESKSPADATENRQELPLRAPSQTSTVEGDEPETDVQPEGSSEAKTSQETAAKEEEVDPAIGGGSELVTESTAQAELTKQETDLPASELGKSHTVQLSSRMENSEVQKEPKAEASPAEDFMNISSQQDATG